MEKCELLKDMVVQLDPLTTKNRMFAGCFMVITEVKPWGAQGYVQALGENSKTGRQAFYRASWGEMEPIGTAVWTIREEE